MSVELSPASPAEVGLDVGRWDTVRSVAQALVDDDTLPAIAVQVVRQGRMLAEPLTCGRLRTGDDTAKVPPDGIFLIASITKPVVAMATLLLVERGAIALNDRVTDLLPEFDAAPRRPMTVRNLLSHTSGLPDMLPNNRKLREANSPLSAFFDGTCAVTLDFPPGHGVQYQSMGFVLLAEIIQRMSGLSCGQFVREEIFDPLGMHDSALGATDDWFADSVSRADRIVDVRVPPEQEGEDDWNWNSRYWRSFGAPWGGMLSSVNDVARFCAAMCRCDVFSPATITAASTNQLHAQPHVPEIDRRTRGWGLGWRLNWLAHPSTFGDLLGSHVIGHWGATGTLCWADRKSNTSCVILSSQPLDRGRNHLVRLSNAVVSALQSHH